MWADGGGKARGAGTQPLHGRMAVAQFVLASTRCPAPNYHADIAEVNGQPAAILRIGEKPLVVIAIQVDSEHVREIRVIGNPDKLRWV
jgi:RNA polymerase sigma-70 factor, ECF subfamily